MCASCGRIGFDAQGDAAGADVVTGIRVVGIYGGPGLDSFSGIAPVSDGGVVVSGRYESSFDLAGNMLVTRGGGDIVVARLAADGTLRWLRTFGSIGSDSAASIAATADSIYLTGGFGAPIDFGGGTLTPTGS